MLDHINDYKIWLYFRVYFGFGSQGFRVWGVRV